MPSNGRRSLRFAGSTNATCQSFLDESPAERGRQATYSWLRFALVDTFIGNSLHFSVCLFSRNSRVGYSIALLFDHHGIRHQSADAIGHSRHSPGHCPRYSCCFSVGAIRWRRYRLFVIGDP